MRGCAPYLALDIDEQKTSWRDRGRGAGRRLEKLSAARERKNCPPSSVRPSSRRPSFVDRVICSCRRRHPPRRPRRWGKRANGSEGGKERLADGPKKWKDPQTDRDPGKTTKIGNVSLCAVIPYIGSVASLFCLSFNQASEWHDWHGTCHVRRPTMRGN